MKNPNKILTNFNTRKRVTVTFKKPSLTEQSHSQECDINYIIKKFTNTGILPTNTRQNPEYGFAPNIDFKSALDLVKSAHQEFNELQPSEKALFNHNPELYAQFLTEYVETPQEHTEDITPPTDTSVSTTKTNAEKKALAKPDEGGLDET